MLLENDIIKLRAVEMSDLDILYQWENDTSLWVLSNTLTPFSKYILKKYIENSNFDVFQSKELKLMIDSKIEGVNTVGMLDIFDIDIYHKRAGIGIMINREFRHMNYASEALSICISYCFDYLNLHQLYCNVAEDNELSKKLFTKMGFVVTGEKKDWLYTKNGMKKVYFLQLINENN